MQLNGFDKALREDILSIVPHISLTKASAVENWQSMKVDLEQEGSVESVQGFSVAFGMLNHLSSVKPVMVYGVDVADPKAIEVYDGFTSDLDWASLKANNGIILATALAKRLNVKPDDTIRLLISDDVQEQVKAIPVRVSALIHTGTELDQKLAIADLGFLSKIKGFPAGSADGLRVQVKDLFQSRYLARKYSELTGLYYFRDWSMTQGNLYHAVQMSKKMVVLLTFIIIAVAAFNVVSTLLLAVNEKQGDMAILQTMGASTVEIKRIFLLQGAVIAAIGVSIGVLIGVLLSLSVPYLASLLEGLLGFSLLDTSVYPVDTLPSDIRVLDVLLVAVISFVLTLVATVFPALKASKQNPAVVLKYD